MREPLEGMHLVRFEAFEVNLTTGEVRKHGIRLKVQGQPFQVLVMLLARPGKLVTRDEIREKLWPCGTFVDFDNGLNTALSRLREALGDSAESPRYIETLARRGYRWMLPVEGMDTESRRVIALVENPGIEVVEAQRSSAFPRTAKWTADFPFTKSKRLALLSSILGFLVLAVVVKVSLNLRSRLPRVIDSSQITNDGSLAGHKVVSDGSRLYFSYFKTGSTESRARALAQVSTQGGETARIPLALEEPVLYDISPTHSELLVGGGAFTSTFEQPLWSLPLPAGSPRRVGDILAHGACWAPDGRHLVFVNGKDLFVAKPDGSEVRKLATGDGFVSYVQFSPDGTRLRFSSIIGNATAQKGEVMEMRADGSGLHRLPIRGCCGTWSADGKYYFYSQMVRDIWVLPERRSILGDVEFGTPVQLTAGPVVFGQPTPSENGKQLFVIGHQHRVELVHYESRAKRFVPFLGGISAGELEVSPDGQWVTYTTYPESTLWRSKLDGSERLQLTFPPINAHEPRWSPDGKKILFTDDPSRIFVVPADGGTPRQLMPEDRPAVIGAGAWLPDGNSILFVRVMGCPPGDFSCLRENAAIYLLDLKTQQVSKLPGSEKMGASRLSPYGRYVSAVFGDYHGKLMLYDFQTKRWSELSTNVGSGSVVWSHDSKFVYLDLKGQPAKLVRISVPDGKVEPALDLSDITLGGYFPGWISLLPDDSPLLMLDRSKHDIYRLELQYL